MTEAEGQNATAAPLRGWRALARDAAVMVRFNSRLPVPRLPFETDAHAAPDFATAPRMLPLAGLIVGLPAALALAAASLLGLPPLLAAGIAVAVNAFITGGFHEDGLADTFDGLGGGWTPERRLEIMKDSRIGSFGATALGMSLILRVAGLSAVLALFGPGAAVAAFIAAASLSRCIGLMPLAWLPPARTGGFSATVGQPTPTVFATALAIALAITAGFGAMAGLPLPNLAIGAALGCLLALGMTRWAKRAIQGQTGDIAGASQQLAEIAFYVGLLMSV